MTSAEQLKIMIMDDDTFLLDIYATKFKDSGADVHVVTSGAEAIKVLEEGFSPNVILLDLVMPEIAGVKVLKIIKEKKLAPHANIIVLSNQSQKKDIAEAQKAGADGYIVKANATPSEVLAEVLKIAK